MKGSVIHVAVIKDFAFFVYEIFKQSIGVLEHAPKAKSGIPTGCAAIDVLGYSISILRDICAQDDVEKGGSQGDGDDVIESLINKPTKFFLFRFWLCHILVLNLLCPSSMMVGDWKQGFTFLSFNSLTSQPRGHDTQRR